MQSVTGGYHHQRGWESLDHWWFQGGEWTALWRRLFRAYHFFLSCDYSSNIRWWNIEIVAQLEVEALKCLLFFNVEEGLALFWCTCCFLSCCFIMKLFGCLGMHVQTKLTKRCWSVCPTANYDRIGAVQVSVKALISQLCIDMQSKTNILTSQCSSRVFVSHVLSSYYLNIKTF